MKRFEFRLQSVLVLRQRLLNEAEQRYTRAISARRDVENQIANAWQRIDRMNQLVVSSREFRFYGASQQAFFDSMKMARVDIRKLEEQLKKVRQQEAVERRKYIEANRNHELLLKLKDKQKESHFQEEILKEQQIQDDLFNARRALRMATRSS